MTHTYICIFPEITKLFYILVIYEQAKNNIKFTITKIDCFLTFFCQKLYPEFAKY